MNEEMITELKKTFLANSLTGFGRNELMNYITDLECQLKSLREYVDDIKSSGINSHFDALVIKESLLKILDKEGHK